MSSSSGSSSRADSPTAVMEAVATEGPSSLESQKMVDEEAGPSASAGNMNELESGIDRLLQRHRSELMFELRSLQHGHRPVTGQDNKAAVESFFNRALQESSGQPDPSYEPPRPEAVTVEVNALVERRPVSSILQSVNLRRSLETVLRGTIGQLSARLPRDQGSTQRTPQAAAAAASGSQVHGETDAQAQASRVPQPRPRHSPTTTRSRSATPNEDTRPRPLPRPSRSQPVPQSTAEPRQEVPQAPQPPALPQENRAQAWLQQQPLLSENIGQDNDLTVWESLGQSQQDSLIMDISELLQHQLVSSTLESAFRNRLEGLMAENLMRTGTDGPRVQQFIQSLPRSTNHQRNDFSDLGLGQHQGDASLSDDVSVISATAAVTVHNAQANAAMSREMNSLKAQLAELKNMMRLNFDLSMDIQRSIRQEVSAAVAGALSGATPASETSSRVTSRPVEDGHCLICLDRSVDAVLYQCGHMCVCHSCGLQLKGRGAHCPVCRAPIRDIIRAYRCNQD